MNEIYKSGLSGDRVMELLRRQYAVPTLPAAPTDSTFSWVDDMGYANTFRVGELCRVKDDDDYIFYILEELKDGEATWIPLSGGGSGEQPEMEAIDRLLKQKLDNLFFSRLFVAIDANGIEISPNDTTTPIASIRANYGLWTEYFLSAKGRNPSTGSSSGGDGASTLGGLNNVADGADVGEEGYDVAKMLVLEANSNLWTLKNLSELVGLDEDALLAYLTTNNYAKKSDIPSLTGYATESWVLGKGYATTSDLDSRIDALVNGAPAAYDTLKEIADVLGKNVDSIADILDALGTKANKVDVDAAISAVNASISALNTELSGKIDLKLDAATFNELFEKVLLEDGKTYAIRAKLGLYTDYFLSAKGANSSGGSSTGGAGALYQLADVAADGQQVSGAAIGALLMYNGTQWQGVAQSEIVPNLTGYAKLTDIPTDDINKGVTAYGWGDHSKVGYLTGITSALVTGALGFTPFDEDSFTKANIKSTLGISDWALASSKPSYTTSEVTEGANLYFTNARAVAALKSITDGLGSDISTLQGYFTNGVAKSAARLSTNTVYKAWGQTFFENGVPKAVSGALTDVTDITSSGTITTNKIVIGNGAIEWDETNKGFKIVGGLYTETYLSSKGANPNGGSSSSGGQYTRLDEWANYSSAYDTWVLSAKLGKGLYDTQNSLITRVGALEGKATNVSFTQSLTSGTQIGTLTIDGASKNIYAPTIPTSDINKGVTAHGWGNHANVGYAMASALSGYQTKITSSNKLDYSLISGVPTKLSQFTNDLGLGTFAYKSSLAFADLTNKPTTLSGYGITDAQSIIKTTGIALNDINDVDSDVNRWNSLDNSWIFSNYNQALAIIVGGVSNNRRANIQVGHSQGNYAQYLGDLYLNKLGGDVYIGNSLALHLGNYTDYTYSKSTIDTKLGGYLPLSGGTISANSAYPLVIKSTTASQLIGFQQGDNPFADVGYYSGRGAMLRNKKGSTDNYISIKDDGTPTYNDNILIHSNNYTDYTYSKSTIDTKLGGYLPLSGGTITSSNFDSLIIKRNSSSAGAFVTYENNNGRLGLIGFENSTNEPIVFHGSTTNKYDYFIHSGNIGSQSVASANKLTTARTIWGQSFDGTKDITSFAVMPYLYFRETDGTYSSYIGLGGSSSDIYLYSTSNIRLYANGSEKIRVDTSGNVGIGTTSPTQKLHVVGSIYAKGGSTNGGYALYWGTNKQYRIGSNDDNDFYIFDDNTSSKAKFRIGVAGADRLNILTNGNVLIGTTTDSGYKLDVNGTLHASDVVTLDKELIGNGWKISQHRSSDVLPFGLELHGDNKALGEIAYYQDHFIVGNFKNGIENSLINFYDNGNVTINPVTCFGIGTTSPQYKLDVNGVIHSNTGIFSDGYVSAKGQNTSSDIRLKNVLNEVELGVSAIANAPSIRFAWKNGGGVDVGSSAQYWQGLLPDAVKERDGMLEMQYANIALLSAIAIAKRVETHEERIERLEREVKELRIENERLKIGGRYAE